MTRLLVALAALVAAGCGGGLEQSSGDSTLPTVGSIVFVNDVTGSDDRTGIRKFAYYAVRPDGTDLRRLRFPEGDWDLSFAADGRSAAISIMPPDDAEDEDFKIDVWDAPSWQPRRVRLPSHAVAGSPALSPDGRLIALAYDTGTGTGDSGSDLLTVSVAGGGLTKVSSTGGVASTAWSPDGSWIAFTDERAASEPDAAVIYIVRPDGSDLHRIDGEFWEQRPAWSPDGTRFALVDLEGRIVVVDPAQDKRRVLTPGDAPAWSPDGKWIAVERNVPTDEEGVFATAIFVVPAAGGPERRIATIDGDVAPLSWTTADLTNAEADAP